VVPQNSYEKLVAISGLYNFRHITHCFRDISWFNAENHIFAYCVWPWIWRSCCWNVKKKFGGRKLESRGCENQSNHDRRSNYMCTAHSRNV